MGGVRDGPQMKRIGLYLDMKPQGGGQFQYSIAMLEAVAKFPRDRYASLVAYSKKGWRDILQPHSIEAVYVPSSLPSRLSAYTWRKFDMPIDVWRKLAPLVDPPTRRLLSLDCDLWIYPVQDEMSYMLPAPALVTVHDLMHRYERHFPEVAGYRMRELHYRAVCRYAKGVLVDSDLGKRQLAESYGIADSMVYPLPYVPPSYMYETDIPPDFKEKYHLPEKFFFYPAQFWHHKNHCSLLRAAHLLSAKLPDIRFVFAGARKNGYGGFVKLVKELGLSERVHILGYLPNAYMSTIYRSARAMIMSTFFGPTNIPPLEAMVAGCPMAVSRIYAMPEQCGDAALYFDPESVDEIAHCMARLWTDDDLCAFLSERGKERSELFSQKAFNGRLLAVVDKVSVDL
jgi:glycosyltransferase involved in cell wall biosynthesis